MAPGERVIHFPKDVSLGTLATRAWDAPEDAPWKKLGDATGDITLEAGQVASLRVMSSKDLEGLAQLEHADLNRLELIGDSITDEVMESIKGLTSIQDLSVLATNFKPKSLMILRRFIYLERLTANGLDLSNANLEMMGTLTNLKYLDLRDTGVMDSGVVNLAKLVNLKRLRLDPTNITKVGLLVLETTLKDCEITPTSDTAP